MYKIRGLVNTDILKTLYYSLIYPHLLYTIQVWGNTFDCHLNTIIVLQKKAIRMMTLNDDTSTTGHLSPSSPLFQELQILKIGDIYKLRTLQFVFDCLNGFCPQFNSWFIISTDLHNLDNYNSLKATNTGPKIWNNLPPC